MAQAVATQTDINTMRGTLSRLEPELDKLLNEGRGQVASKKFVRTAQTALSFNPDIALCSANSVMGACLKAANDGLLLDGREAALVVFNVNTGTRDAPKWEKTAQYMPMMQGILKRIRNSGEIKTITAHLVYEKDHYRYIRGDAERIEHEELYDGDRGKVVRVYAICYLKNGGIEREVMTTEEVEQVRSISRAKDSGPWVKWWGEMARKTVLRRLAKRLPLSAEIVSIFDNDDTTYDMTKEIDAHMDVDGFAAPKSPAAPIKAKGAAAKRRAESDTPIHDAKTGEVIEGDFKRTDAGSEPPPPEPPEEDPDDII